MVTTLFYKVDTEDAREIGEEILFFMVGEVRRDTDRVMQPAYVGIGFTRDELKAQNLEDLPRSLRRKATRLQEKINRIKAGSREETVHGGLIKDPLTPNYIDTIDKEGE